MEHAWNMSEIWNCVNKEYVEYSEGKLCTSTFAHVQQAASTLQELLM